MAFSRQALTPGSRSTNRAGDLLNEKNRRHAIPFQDKKLMIKVCYLNDIFTAVNNLNTLMHGRNQNIITLSEKLSASKEKLQLLEDVTGVWTNNCISINERVIGGIESNCK